jgi:hypothetical protein
MSKINKEALRDYLRQIYEPPIVIDGIDTIGGMNKVDFLLKDYGYGTHLHLFYSILFY